MACIKIEECAQVAIATTATTTPASVPLMLRQKLHKGWFRQDLHQDLHQDIHQCQDHILEVHRLAHKTFRHLLLYTQCHELHQGSTCLYRIFREELQ